MNCSNINEDKWRTVSSHSKFKTYFLSVHLFGFPSPELLRIQRWSVNCKMVDTSVLRQAGMWVDVGLCFSWLFNFSSSFSHLGVGHVQSPKFGIHGCRASHRNNTPLGRIPAPPPIRTELCYPACYVDQQSKISCSKWVSMLKEKCRKIPSVHFPLINRYNI